MTTLPPTPTLLELFDGLICEEFQFSKRDIGDNYCISSPHILDNPNGSKLALHLNFRCKVSGLRKDNKLNLAISAFHITARPVLGQQTIDEHGPSILTAKESIHINRNTDWGPDDNLDELLRKLNVQPDSTELEVRLKALNPALSARGAFCKKAVPSLVKEWKEKIKNKAQRSTRIMNITWNNSDKTFPSD